MNYKGKESQSLLNEVKYSNSSHRERIPRKGFSESQSLLNEVKYSNPIERFTNELLKALSQSLLNEVKYSNEKKALKKTKEELKQVAIPFKWGQVFQHRP